jgi:N-hydroxyarylamine O-acetyltransferase
MIQKIHWKVYLERIGYHGPIPPSVEVLHRFHVRHLLSVPFENLEIHLDRPIILTRQLSSTRSSKTPSTRIA